MIGLIGHPLASKYYTARRRYFAAAKGSKNAWHRELVRTYTACMKAGIRV